MPAVTFPQRYQVSATATPRGDVVLLGDGLRALRSQPPRAFGGSADRWSPETLLVGALADCYALTFRAIAKAVGLPWTSIECDADGTVEHVDRVTRFSAFRLRVCLTIPRGVSEEQARRTLALARERCLVTQSLKAPCTFDHFIDVVESTEVA